MATDQSQTSRGGCSTTVKVLGTIAALITAIAGLIGAFNALSSPNSGTQQQSEYPCNHASGSGNPGYNLESDY